MGKLDKELSILLDKIRRRLTIIKLMNSFILSVSGALIAGIFLSIISRFIPIYDVYGKVLILTIIALLIGLTVTFLKAPNRKEAALISDTFGLKERTSTALELLGKDEGIYTLQKDDALIHLRAFDYKRAMPIKGNKKYIAVLLVIVGAFLVTAFIPNPMKGKAEELHKQSEKVSKAQAKVEKMIEKMEKNPQLSLEQKKEVVKKLQGLKQDLKESVDEKDLNKKLQKWDKKIELIHKEFGNEDLDKISDTLSKNESTKALSEYIKNRDSSSIKKDLKDFEKELMTMTPSKLKALAEEYKELAEELKNSPELKDALLKLAESMESGELGDLSKELSNVEKALEELLYDPNLAEALEDVSKELGEMQGSKEGNQGAGLKDGNAGSQAGSGTDKGQEDQTPKSPTGGIGKKSEGESKTGEYEKVFTPKTLGEEGETSILEGKKGSGGSIEKAIAENSPTLRGEAVPYNKVIGEYKQNAIESMNHFEIPEGMKELVKNYFSTLEE